MCRLNNKSLAVVIGASTGVGRALAEALARQGRNVALIASEIEEISILAKDIQIRYQVRAQYFVQDLADPGLNSIELLLKIKNEMGTIHYLFYPAGYVSDDDNGQISAVDLERTILVNQLSASKLITSLLQAPDLDSLKTIVLFSSIAALVPRSRNVVYASAKAGLEYFAQGIRHWLSDKGTIIQVYSLGYVDTGMSFGQKLLFPVVHPEDVAKEVIKNLDKDFGKKYYPGYWLWIVMVLRSLPWFIYKKLKF